MEQNPAALAAIRALRDLGGDAGGVLEGFATAKRMLEGRFKQYTSFLSQSPWNLVALLGYLLPSQDASAEIHKSRTLALKLLKDHDAGRLGNTGDVWARVFQSPEEIPHWIGEMGTWHRPLHEPTTLSGTCCLLLKPVGDAKARSEASSDTRCYTF